MNVSRKRVKWEPAALMVLVLGLGLWIAFGPGSKPAFPIAPDALTQDIRIGNTRGLLEARPINGASDRYEFRVWLKDSPQQSPMTMSQAEAVFGKNIVDETLSTKRNWIFRWLNITSWVNLVWIGIGLFGQVVFSGRMLLQWITSERHRKSVIGESFWWFSLIGGVTLFSYFVWRQDPVAILGQASGIVIYARNIRLLRKSQRREARVASDAGDTNNEP